MPDAHSAERPDFFDLVVGTLRDNGPMSESQLLDVLAEQDADKGALYDVADDVESLVYPLLDDRWVWLPSLLADRVFTHRLTAREVDHELLDVLPDLAPIAVVTDSESYQTLADGSPLVSAFPMAGDTLTERGISVDVLDDFGALILPDGRLADLGLEAGDLVGLRLTPAGLALEQVGDHPVSDDVVASLGMRLESVLVSDDAGPQELDSAIFTVCADDPELFAQPLPPLAEALEACGLVRHGEWIAGPGFDFDRWQFESRCDAISRQHRLDDDQALAVAVLVKLYEQTADLLRAAHAAAEDGGDEAVSALFDDATEPHAHSSPEDRDRELVRDVAAQLADPSVAEALVAEALGPGVEGAPALGLFAESLESQDLPRDARPALRWMRAKAHERLGELAQAESAYEAAESLDPDWTPTLEALARYASDRGDATRGLSLLRRAGTPDDDPMRQLLERFQVQPRRGLGRNEPCWCGSGRKYKKCHLNNESLPLADRAAWLYQKAGVFMHDGPWRLDVIEAARVRAQYDESPLALLEALEDPLVNDAVLFEGGAFGDFVATRGALLPDDERLLAEQWMLVERSVYDIEDVSPGSGLTARDLRTGDVHQIRERTASRLLGAGDLVCARVVPAGDTMQIFGGAEPVALHQRDELTALLDDQPEPLELVAFLTRRLAPPALANTEGDPLVWCDASVRVGDAAALGRALDETYDRQQGDTPQWIEHVTTQGMERIRATLRLEPDILHVHANSHARIDRVLETVRRLDPAATVVDDSRQPMRDIREAAEVFERSPLESDAAQILDPKDPNVQRALAEFTREYEQRWLDEPIPALADYTPRQAAADPTRRDDLIRLIDSFPDDQGDPGIMSPGRLRTALGLD